MYSFYRNKNTADFKKAKMNLFNKQQIKEFERYTEAEYKQDLSIQKYIKTKPIKRTDGKFIQIGLRPLVDIDFFDKNSSYSPTIIGLGSSIANEEVNYFINKILKEVKKGHINVRQFSKEKLAHLLSQFSSKNDLITIVPTNFHYDYMLKTPNEWIRWDKSVTDFVFETGNLKIPVYWVHDKIIKNNIIILNKDFGIWKYVLFNHDKRLDIKVGNIRQGFKTDITIRSLIKFEILDKGKIEVIELRNFHNKYQKLRQ